MYYSYVCRSAGGRHAKHSRIVACYFGRKTSAPQGKPWSCLNPTLSSVLNTHPGTSPAVRWVQGTRPSSAAHLETDMPWLGPYSYGSYAPVPIQYLRPPSPLPVPFFLSSEPASLRKPSISSIPKRHGQARGIRAPLPASRLLIDPLLGW